MSIELPEALILTRQMQEILIGKEIASYHLQNFERMQKIGFLNKNIVDFDRLLNKKIIDVQARGNTIRLELENDMNLIVAPEYGGEIFYITDDKTGSKYHLKVSFTDASSLTVRIKSMGCILALDNKELDDTYMYKRDFLNGISPVENEFSEERFSQEISVLKRNLKAILVGKDAILVGISNSAFQDIIYRAKLFPKKKGSELDLNERKTLFESINSLIQERIQLGGKIKFLDLHGNEGKYIPKMGPNKKDTSCSECGTAIEKMTFGGGQIYFCPTCQER
ncbi:MAG: DNA-formamidopyrimidine glycosylase family protein [Candidatus Hodarchaeales archaeon]